MHYDDFFNEKVVRLRLVEREYKIYRAILAIVATIISLL